MNKQIKLLVLDIDGTLVGRDFILSREVIRAIKRIHEETEIIVVLASGRMTYSTLLIAEQLDIDTPLIVYQGAMVNDVKNNKILFHQTLNPDLGKLIIEDIENENIHVNVYINDCLYMKQLSEMAKTYTSYRSVTPNLVSDFDIMFEHHPTKILGLDADIEKVDRLICCLQKKYEGKLSIFGSNPIFIEIVNPDVNKGKTVIKFAKELWDVDAENIMAIGDGNNDYTMIKDVGYGVAMGNATEQVKSAAKYHTLPVSEHGAAVAIEKLIFEGAERIL